MCKAWHQYNERLKALALLNSPLFWFCPCRGSKASSFLFSWNCLFLLMLICASKCIQSRCILLITGDLIMVFDIFCRSRIFIFLYIALIRINNCMGLNSYRTQYSWARITFVIELTFNVQYNLCWLVGCFCCFTSQVNSYGHCGTVSSLCKTATLKRTKISVFKTNYRLMHVKVLQNAPLCRSKVLQNAPRGALCNTFDLH